ncbi:MAG: SPASM domain-containing protein [Candidatus Taylorbacteria bacterium]
MTNIFPNVPATLPAKSELPNGTSRMIWKWSFPEGCLHGTVTIKGVKYKKLLTLDLNIPEAGFAQMVNSAPLGEAEKIFTLNYPCPHKCPGCFNEAELHNPIMTLKEVWKVVDDAIELGLESVKFLGPGELLANPQLFQILDGFRDRGIVVGIFTKGAIMGNDALAHHYHGISSKELVKKLVSYPNVTFLVGGRSFDPHFENLFIPRNERQINEKFDYHAARGIALERLCEAGMNADLTKPRLAIICSPVTSQNLSCVAEIYKWGAERNIPVYLPPTMVSGKGHKLVRKASEKKFEDDYIRLAVEVYLWAIDRGVMTHEQFLEEGPHPYIGVAPCNQLTHGLYIHYDGTVQRCPGNDTPDFVVHPNVRTAPLREIWKNSKNYAINQFNNGCVKDGVSLPKRFYGEVKAKVNTRQ